MFEQGQHKNFQQEYEFGKILANLKFTTFKFKSNKPLENLCFVIKQTTYNEPQAKFGSQRKEAPIEACTKEELKEFLNSQPRPNWKQRIEMINKYNPDLAVNWQAYNKPDKCKCGNKIILNKKLFELFVELTRGIKKTENKTVFVKLCRNSQRGVVKMMEKEGFKNNSNYLRTHLVFVRKN
ncbi:hypothetical protein M0813_27024 [Anaeramoeba flamelloides]|uniref:Uncharacterized protein n=1 Tax=Anaeramoeba flamelloides TaxID=1746091 RepID=A0AAV8A584_9EUKA|nr:hypothetical protein M0812_07614 [Anaeramoeba flamelloides]KAJ6237463.1 hypothetical protein M0813_27024 [Anaeramoeba flamelloides]